MLGACLQVGVASRGPSYINICFKNPVSVEISITWSDRLALHRSSSWQVGVYECKCLTDTSVPIWRLKVPHIHICGSFYGSMYVLFSARAYLFQLGNTSPRDPAAGLRRTNGRDLNTTLHAQPSVSILLRSWLYSTTPINFGWGKIPV